MTATILGQQIAYSDAGKGVPLLMLHAFPLHRGMYASQQAALASHCRLITMDMPGMGESPPASDVTMPRQAEWAFALLDHLQIASAVLGGVSMGGYAALAAWPAYAGRIRGLILADTKPLADTADGRAARQAAAQLALDKGSTAVAEAMLPKLLGETTRAQRPAVVAQVRAMIVGASASSIAQYQLAMAERQDSNPLLAHIPVPVLVLAGDEDEITPASAAREWSAGLPAGEFAPLAQAGHLACMEDPEAFNTAIADWLAYHPELSQP